MKKLIKKPAIIALFVLFLSITAFPQPPLPPGHGEPDDQPAPIGSGIAILLALGVAYGAKKVYNARKNFRN